VPLVIPQLAAGPVVDSEQGLTVGLDGWMLSGAEAGKPGWI
jgi:hypothetical protein